MSQHEKYNLNSQYIQFYILQMVLLKTYNVNKTIEIDVDNNNQIFLNDKCIGSISGFQANIFDEKVLFKNKFLKEKISKADPVIRAILRSLLLRLNDINTKSEEFWRSLNVMASLSEEEKEK